MELKIISPEGVLPAVEFNADEIKAHISEQVKRFTNLQVTEEGITEAKKELAQLRKFREVFEERRKELKKKYLEPYEAFEAQYKEIISIIDEPIDVINKQIKAFDEQAKVDKKQKIKEYYQKQCQDIVEVLTFEKIFNPQWLNASYSSTKISDEIKKQASKFREEYKAIDNLDSPYKQQIRTKYIDTLDIAAALKEAERLSQQAEQVKKMQEANKARAEQEAKLKAEQDAKLKAVNDLYRPYQKPELTPQQAPEPKAETPQSPIQTPQTPPQEKEYTLTIKITTTEAKLKALKDFLAASAIKYERV
jgi:hypothetical protein